MKASRMLPMTTYHENSLGQPFPFQFPKKRTAGFYVAPSNVLLWRVFCGFGKWRVEFPQSELPVVIGARSFPSLIKVALATCYSL